MNKILITLFLWSFAQSALAAPDTLTCDINQSSFTCLVCNCYHETRGEPLEGMIAVAKTVLSRKESNSREFANTVCDVVFQPSQFSWTINPKGDNIRANEPAEKENLRQCREVADRVMNEGGNGLLYFYNPRLATPAWAKDAGTPERPRGKLTFCGRAGGHHFLVLRDDPCPRPLSAARPGSGRQQQRSSNGGSTR